MLPTDLLNLIYENDKLIFKHISKKYYIQYKIEMNATSTIIEFFIKYCRNTNIEDFSKKRLVRFFAHNYLWDHLNRYPTFLVKKCKLFSLTPLAITAEATNSKVNIINFLENPSISREDILYAGF